MSHAKSHLREQFAELVEDLVSFDFAFENEAVDRQIIEDMCRSLWNCTDALPRDVDDNVNTICPASPNTGPGAS
jgi:hypothetical protein